MRRRGHSPSNIPGQGDPPSVPPRRNDLPPIERIQAVKVEPGDVLVVKVPAHNPSVFADLRERLLELMAETFPGHEILVVAGDIIDLSVMRPQRNLTMGPPEIRKADGTPLTAEEARRIVQGFRDVLVDRGIA